MTDIKSNNTPAKVHSKTWFSIVWLIPLIALIAALWLLITNIRETGPTITLHISSAEDIDVGKTPITVLNVEMGIITNIRLNQEHSGVIVTAQMRADASDLLKEDSLFWVVKPRIDAYGVTGLSTLFSGAYIELVPGKSETKQDEFFVDENPVQRTSQDGLSFVVFLEQSIQGLVSGAPVMYKGINVGVVAEVPYFMPEDREALFENKYIPVKILIEPTKIVNKTELLNKEQWLAKINKAIELGLYATVDNSSFITGSKHIELLDIPRTEVHFMPHQTYASYPVIPTRKTGIEHLTNQVTQVLNTANQVLNTANQFIDKANQVLDTANQFIAGPELQQMPREINKTLAELQTTLHGLSPDSPGYINIQNTIKRLDSTIQKMDPLLRKLNEKPNLFIFDSNQSDVIPRGSK